MRKDPIISEDWKIGKTEYFNFQTYQFIEFFLSLIIILIALVESWQMQIFFSVFLWVFTMLGIIVVELLIDQKARGFADRIIVFLLLLFLAYLTLRDAEEIIAISLGVLFALKFIIIPIDNFIQEYNEEILVPNSDKVQYVLDDHVARLSETNFEVEENTEFQKRVFARIKEFIFILIASIVSSLVIYLVYLNNQEIGGVILIGFLAISSLSFSYTTISWYINERRQKRKKEYEKSEFEEDEIFPEMIE